ncbi:MAG: ABC transporter ATP-binding protein [Chloroflexi bacterium]|nr:ABC transporter ATP-binding protein [Chloroflexota bacterium]MBV9542963.1 ABC transporter ATP-binding protein [Chloroflexota bacterium]
MMLEVDDLHAFYGASHVVQGVSFSIDQGEAVALMGRNGVGKTSTLKSIMGMDTRTRGTIKFLGKPFRGVAAHQRAARGLGYVPEERAVFPQMTVEENIRIGALLQPGSDQQGCLERAYSLFPILRERRKQMAGTLSGGQQKMLALARAIALQPKLLMVDEPTEGLMPANVELITNALVAATQSGLTVLVVDSSFDLVRQLCSRIYAMDRGVLTGRYSPADFSSPDELAATYLGTSQQANGRAP